MEAQDQIQRNFQIMAVFMHARASKAPYHRMRVNCTFKTAIKRSPTTQREIHHLYDYATKDTVTRTDSDLHCPEDWVFRNASCFFASETRKKIVDLAQVLTKSVGVLVFSSVKRPWEIEFLLTTMKER